MKSLRTTSKTYRRIDEIARKEVDYSDFSNLIMLNSNATAYLVLKKSTKFLKILPAGKSTIINNPDNKNGLKALNKRRD